MLAVMINKSGASRSRLSPLNSLHGRFAAIRSPRFFSSGVFAIATMESHPRLMTRRPASHASGSHTLQNLPLQARRADTDMLARVGVVFFCIKPRGLAAPAYVMPPLRGW